MDKIDRGRRKCNKHTWFIAVTWLLFFSVFRTHLALPQSHLSQLISLTPLSNLLPLNLNSPAFIYPSPTPLLILSKIWSHALSGWKEVSVIILNPVWPIILSLDILWSPLALHPLHFGGYSALGLALSLIIFRPLHRLYMSGPSLHRLCHSLHKQVCFSHLISNGHPITPTMDIKGHTFKAYQMATVPPLLGLLKAMRLEPIKGPPHYPY